QLDAEQWVQVAKECGFKYLILTAKHHDGFCLWQTRYTEHCVRNSAWRMGKGDVVREFARACQQAGLKMGIYLSPWDRHERTYGDSPAYNRYFINQLTELLTDYGEVAEVWFDGACGEGPNGRRQEYDWQGYYAVIRKLQPNALIAICGPDIRWVGNEDGYAAETEWSVQDPVPAFHGNVTGPVWWPAECDVSIRPGWFYHEHEDSKVKSLEHLLDIYCKSVGRNSVLLLNVPPDRRGLLPDVDVQRLREWRKALDRIFAKDLALRKPAQASSVQRGCVAARAVDGKRGTYWMPRKLPAYLEIDLRQPTTFNLVMLQEYIAEGQHVEEYSVEALAPAGWQELKRGTTIGRKKLDRVAPVTTTRVRVNILRARALPLIRAVSLYHAPEVRVS
ncbi:MAG: alpha-L-fucosidase, partial [bacterium]|nr:alpha-L-fucosidase [bacterium]